MLQLGGGAAGCSGRAAETGGGMSRRTTGARGGRGQGEGVEPRRAGLQGGWKQKGRPRGHRRRSCGDEAPEGCVAVAGPSGAWLALAGRVHIPAPVTAPVMRPSTSAGPRPKPEFKKRALLLAYSTAATEGKGK